MEKNTTKKTKETSNRSVDSNEVNRSALREVRARVIEVRKSTNVKDGKSKKADDDPLYHLGESGRILEMPFDALSLTLLLEHSGELAQCIEAMEVNIESFGHRFIPRTKNNLDVKLPGSLKEEMKKERVFLENFFSNCTFESFVNFRRRRRKDLESTGNCFFEVVRGASGDIQSFVHIPAYQVRLGRQDKDLVKTERPAYQLQLDGSVKIVELTEWRRFRTYVQSRLSRRQNLDIIPGDRIRWFKEFGDVRVYDSKTGHPQSEMDEEIPWEEQANEIIYVDLYSARSPYGLPRYIGNLLSIFGDRAAEEINYVTFKNNNIPSMVILCSNGQLTQGSVERIESFVESQVQGSDNYSKFLIVEAEGDLEGEDGSQIKLEIKPLTEDQHTDALFQTYSKNSKDNVRRSFRLPPILVGHTADYNKATADTSRRLADEQIFAPERDEFDALMNRLIFPVLGILYHKYRSNSPNTTDNEQLVKMLATSEKTGGMTPFIARFILEGILGQDLPPFPEKFDQHMPFSLLMAEAVKNKADPTEPGQQVTAIKSDGTVDGDVLITLLKKVLSPKDPLIEHLVSLQTEIEKQWSADLDEDHDHNEEGDHDEDDE